MGTFVLKRKLYTVYDETDNLKRMKDSDILAEKRKTTNYVPAAAAAAGGAAVGAAAAGTIGGINGLTRKAGGRLANGARGFKSGGKFGAAAGAILAGGYAFKKAADEEAENSQYNKRLGYAQRQARRREKADWKANMTTRDGYSY